MNSKVTTGLLLVLVVVVALLTYQNYRLGKKVETLSAQVEENKALQNAAQNKPANTGELSPFDKPHTDPMEGQLNGNETTLKNATTIQFEKTVHDFGRINEGEPARTVFKYTNNGKFPLLISNAQASCGCTVPNWSRSPVQPGEKGIIEVSFDSHGKRGETEKTVMVTANTNPTNTVLTIKSTVIPIDK